MASIEEPEVPVETPDPSPPAAEPSGGEPSEPSYSAPEPDPRQFEELNQRFRERTSGVESRRQLQARLARQESEREDLLRQQRESNAALEEIRAALFQEEEPEYGQEWVKRQFDQQRDGILSEVKPALEFINEFREERQRQMEQFRAAQEAEQRASYMAGLLQHAEAEYAATPAGNGFQGRLQHYQARISQMYQGLGIQDTRPHVIAHLQRTVAEAQQLGYHPAVYVDRMYGQMYGAPQNAPQGAQAGDRGQGEGMAQAHARAANSGLAGSLSQGGASKPAVRSKPGQAGAASEILQTIRSGNLKGPARKRIVAQMRQMAERRGLK